MRRAMLGAVCATIAVAFLCVPTWFSMQEHNSVISKWLYGSRLAYEGELHIWVVNANADGKDALFSWLMARSAFYKERHFGIYPTFEEAMTIQEVQQRLAAGEVPDVILCGNEVPKSVLEHADVYEGPFPMPLMLPQYEGGLLTPVLRSAVVVLINEDALYMAGLNPPAGLYGMDQTWIDTTRHMPNAFGYDDATSLMAVVVSEMPQSAQQALIKAEPCDIQDLLNGEIAVFVTLQHSLWYLYRQELLGRSLPGIAAYPLCGFVPRVQYAMLMQNDDEKRQEAARAFIKVLVGKTAQTALSDIYALPIVSGTTCERTDLQVLWPCVQGAQYVYTGNGKEEFLHMLKKGATPEALGAYVIGLCIPP